MPRACSFDVPQRGARVIERGDRMAFLVLGIVLLGLKLAEYGPVALWSWLWVLAPFALAIAWWAFADGSGLTKRREMNKMEAKKTERRQRNMEALGLGQRRERKARYAGPAASGERIGKALNSDPTQC
jgi:small Trp-rich protein